MPDIAAANVTHTISSRKKLESGEVSNVLTVAFGDGALTYPTNGVPLTAAKMGCPNNILSVNIINPDASNGFVYKYDLANNKIRIYQGNNDGVADSALVELVGASATPAAASLVIEAIGY
jgi:hypothetical protein